MTILSRRTMLAGAASATALPSFALWSAQSASAATDPVGKQAASFTKWRRFMIRPSVGYFNWYAASRTMWRTIVNGSLAGSGADWGA